MVISYLLLQPLLHDYCLYYTSNHYHWGKFPGNWYESAVTSATLVKQPWCLSRAHVTMLCILTIGCYHAFQARDLCIHFPQLTSGSVWSTLSTSAHELCCRATRCLALQLSTGVRPAQLLPRLTGHLRRQLALGCQHWPHVSARSS